MSAPIDPTAPPTLGALPAAVRSRIVAMVADSLPAVPDLPPVLRRVADFAPARRARAGAGVIAGALADEDLRVRVATQVSVRVGTTSADELVEPVELAARAWLLREERWHEQLEDALTRVAEPGRETGQETELERLRDRVDQAEQRIRDLRAAHRAQVDDYKAEISTLRRKLGEARTAERAARAAGDDALRAADEARAAAEAQLAAQDKEVRRLRAQVTQLEAEVATARRTARSERDDATVRARILLDTVIDAAAGLQRELGLPPVSETPGEKVEGRVAQARAVTPKPAAALGGGRPALLEQYLSMPRARLIVDGYNVSKNAWPQSSLETQRARLVSGLASLVARTGAETTVVFDAASSSTRPVVPAPRGVKVLFSPEGVIADDVIRDLVAAEPAGRVVVVVTSDQAVAGDVSRAAARTVGADALIALF